jgi:hypothetical protein
VPGQDNTVTRPGAYLAAGPLSRAQPAGDSGAALLAIDGGSPVRAEPWPTYDKGAVAVGPQDEEAALRAVRSHLYFRYDNRAPQETECCLLESELKIVESSKRAYIPITEGNPC